MSAERVTQEMFATAVCREFAFVSGEDPQFSEHDGVLLAVYEADDLRIVVKCIPSDGALWTALERPSLGRVVELETFHYLHAAEPDYPVGTGLPWPTPADFDRQVSEEAEILRLNLEQILSDTETFEEVGGRLA